MAMAHAAAGAEARLIHYELAGRYSIKAAQSQIPNLDVIDVPPMEAYAHCHVPELPKPFGLPKALLA